MSIFNNKLDTTQTYPTSKCMLSDKTNKLIHSCSYQDLRLA